MKSMGDWSRGLIAPFVGSGHDEGCVSAPAMGISHLDMLATDERDRKSPVDRIAPVQVGYSGVAVVAIPPQLGNAEPEVLSTRWKGRREAQVERPAPPASAAFRATLPVLGTTVIDQVHHQRWMVPGTARPYTALLGSVPDLKLALEAESVGIVLNRDERHAQRAIGCGASLRDGDHAPELPEFWGHEVTFRLFM